VLSEWDTLVAKILLPLGPGSSSRWEDIPKDGMVGLRLLCPKGNTIHVGELEAPEGHRFFQLKVGGKTVTMTFGGASVTPTSGHYQDAHIIGVVKDDQGNCLCRAWETVTEIIDRGKTTETIPVGVNYLIDNTRQWQHNCFLRRKGILEVFGVSKPIWGNSKGMITIVGQWPETIKGSPSAIPNNTEYLVTTKKKQLIEFEDNILDMKYHKIGRLSLDVQGLKA